MSGEHTERLLPDSTGDPVSFTRTSAPVGRFARWRMMLMTFLGLTALLTLSACGGATSNGSGGATTPGDTPSSTSSGSSNTGGPVTATDNGDGTITVQHSQGTTEVPANPEKVFVFDLGVMDTMNAIGVKPAGVPEAQYPESLQGIAEGAEKIGAMKEPDFETIATSGPDLIITSGRTAEAYGELSKIAPTVNLAVDMTDPLESFEANAKVIGTIFGKTEAVDGKLRGIEGKIEDARSTLKEAGKGSGLIVLTSAGEVTAYGAGSRFGLIHDLLGIPTAADVKAEGAHGESISFEYIAETNPDLLFVIDRDAATGEGGQAADAVLDNDLVNGTNAARNGDIIQLDPTNWYVVGYGLNSLPQMINQVVNGVVTESTTGGTDTISDN